MGYFLKNFIVSGFISFLSFIYLKRMNRFLSSEVSMSKSLIFSNDFGIIVGIFQIRGKVLFLNKNFNPQKTHLLSLLIKVK